MHSMAMPRKTCHHVVSTHACVLCFESQLHLTCFEHTCLRAVLCLRAYILHALGIRVCVLYYESELTAYMFYESELTANMFRAYVLV